MTETSAVNTNKNKTLIGITICLVLTVGVLAGAKIATSGQGMTNATIATVDLSEVMGQYLKHTGDLDVLDQKRGADQLAVATILDEMKALDEEISVYALGTDEHRDATKKAGILQARYKVEGYAAQAFDNQRRATLYVKVYDKIHREISTYCANNKVDLVLLKTGAESVKGNSKNEVMNAMVVRGVIHSNDSMDITKAIIAELKK